MKVIEYSIDIAAPPQAVWDVLTDVDAYTAMNTALAARVHMHVATDDIR